MISPVIQQQWLDEERSTEMDRRIAFISIRCIATQC